MTSSLSLSKQAFDHVEREFSLEVAKKKATKEDRKDSVLELCEVEATR